MSEILRAEKISHRYAGRPVLREVSFSVGEGEIFGLLGPSGAGKTTLVKILTGQLVQTGGDALLFGRDTRALTDRERRQIGVMLDDLGLYDRLSARENLAFYAAIGRTERGRVDGILQSCGLYGARRTPAAKLSKGMRSRLSLARALMGGAGLLFLDEPTAGLDPAAARGIQQILREERRRGTAILLTTHNMAEAQSLCDRVALLSEGKIAALGAPDALCRQRDRQKKLTVTLRGGETLQLENTAASAPALCRYLAQGQLEAIHSTEPTLEDVFLELTGRRLCEE